METQEFNIATCPLCKSEDATLEFVKFNYSHYHCCYCKSLYVYPSPSLVELEKFYRLNDKNQLSQVCWTDYADSHRHVWNVWRQALGYIEKFSGRGRLLDVGCGTGQFLAFAKKLGWTELIGIEWNPEVAGIARQFSGAVIYTSDLISLSLPSQSFSGIVLWDVIEHLNDVQSALKEVFRLLKPGGTIFIGTVHRHGFSMRLLKEHALTINPPEHLLFFTQMGMSHALHSVGFNVKKQWSFSIYLREWLHLVSKFNTNQTGKQENEIYCPSNISHSKLLLMLIKIFNVILSFTNLGDELVTIGHKPITDF